MITPQCYQYFLPARMADIGAHPGVDQQETIPNTEPDQDDKPDYLSCSPQGETGCTPGATAFHSCLVISLPTVLQTCLRASEME